MSTTKCRGAVAPALQAAPSLLASVDSQIVRRQRVSLATMAWDIRSPDFAAIDIGEVDDRRTISTNHAPDLDLLNHPGGHAIAFGCAPHVCAGANRRSTLARSRVAACWRQIAAQCRGHSCGRARFGTPWGASDLGRAASSASGDQVRSDSHEIPVRTDDCVMWR
jgi:hypothetical protein